MLGRPPAAIAGARPERPAWPTFVRAAALLRPHRSALAAFLLTIAASSVVGLLVALLIRQVIDDALARGDATRLNVLALLILGISVLGGSGAGGPGGAGGLAGVLGSYLGNSISQAVMHDLRVRLFGHLSRMSLAWFTAHRTGETLARVHDDVQAIQSVFTDLLGSVVGNVIALTSTFAVMLALDWRLALFAVAFVPLFVVPARRVGNIQRGLRRETQQQVATLAGHMQESLSVSGALLMKTFGRQREERARFEATSRRIRQLAVRRAMTGRWFMMAMGLFGSVGVALVYGYGGHRVIGGTASVGTVVALAAILPRLFGPIASLVGLHVTVLGSLALFERIFDYLDLRPDIDERPGAVELGAGRGPDGDAPRGRLELREVTFAYEPGRTTLDGISLTVPPGAFAALVGPTGAGKTTIAYLVQRLYDVQSGAVLIDGHDVREVTLASLCRTVGMVQQEPFLLHASIQENLRYARPEASDAEVEAAARAANIHDTIARLPAGYDTVVGERGYRLSGGEKQRVAIARALLADPPVLILDEATSSVDTVTERAIQEALERVTRGRTVLAIAHRLSTVLHADVIFVIDGGRLVESGTHAELVARGGRYRTLYEQQLPTGEPAAGPEQAATGGPAAGSPG